MYRFPTTLLSHILLAVMVATVVSGCGAVAPNWRHDALTSFNITLGAGADRLEPEESDIIRQTIAQAQRYEQQGMAEDADRLYRLAGRESRLLYRNLKFHHANRIPVASQEVNDAYPVADAAANQGQSGSVEELLPDDEPPQWEPVPTHPSPLVSEESAAPPSTAALEPPPATDAANGTGTARAKGTQGTTAKKLMPGRTTLYLTFDDGPSRLTLPIASYLKSQGVAATFFALGVNITGRETIIKTTIGMGHHIGSHTMSHNLHKLAASFASGTNEINRTGELIDPLGGDGLMVRIPYGSLDKKLISNIVSTGAQIFAWNINSYDTSARGVHDHRFIERAVLQQLSRNDKQKVVLLFHDGAGHDATLAALRTLVPRLKQEGYRFGVLSRNERVARVYSR